MERGPAEDAVVIVKSGAEEVVETWLRVKRQIRGRRLEVKGRPRKRSMKLIRDHRSEISQNGAPECPRRRHRVNRKRDDR